jgi:hypothetical protein
MSTAALDTAPTVRIHLLGVVSATVGGSPIALGGPRVRALLAALALAKGRTLSAETLLRDVWGESTPGVRSALRANISRLRATPLGAHLRGGRDGYALVRGPGLDVDLWHLDDLTGGAGSLVEVIPWVDAVPFDGAGTSPYLSAARAATRRQVRRAVVRAIDADPDHPLAMVTAERLLAREPGDAELRALVMAGRVSGTPSVRIGRDPVDDRSDSVVSAESARLIGLPAPIAAYLPRPEDDAVLPAAMRLSRLVTVVGPAGIGKTRLSVEWCRGAGSATAEHVWFCSAGGSWVAELARTVGADGATLASVIARMRPFRGIVLIDGLDPDEGLDSGKPRTSAADLATFLAAVPGVAALVTARRPLGIPGESVHRVGPLSETDARALLDLRSSRPIPVEDADFLTAAVGRLPLAIELAAARVSHMPLATVVDALIAPSTGATRNPLENALSATIALTTDPQQATLRRLCAFRGPIARETAVGLGEGPGDIDALVSWSLVTEESRSGIAILALPEIVRRHVGMDDTPQLRRRRTEWFAARTLAAFEDLTTAEAGRVWPRIDAERADLDAAFEHAIESGDRMSALSISAGMSWWGLSSGTQAASLAMARRAAAVPGEAEAVIEARGRLGHGFLAYQLGAMAEAGTVLTGALEHAQRSADRNLIASAHAYLAYLATLEPDGTRRAVAAIAAAMRHLDGASDSVRAMVTLIAAQVARSQGDDDTALRLAHTAGELARAAGNSWVLLMSGVVAAKARIDARDPRGAVALIRSALEDERVSADPIGILIATSVAAGAAAGLQADAVGARIIGAVDAIGPRFGFDPRANEPADFDRYRRLVQQGLTPVAWRDAYARGAGMTLGELIDVSLQLARR